MPGAKPGEFLHRALELARLGEKPVAEIAKDLVVDGSGLRRWMAPSDIGNGKSAGVTRHERIALVRLRRESRVRGMAIEVLKRTSAYFAWENVVPK